MGRRAVGSFIILRIISPSIVSPAWMQLDLEGLNPSGRRALVDVSKLVTNLANDVVLGQKESHMGEFQSFRSEANIQAMERFLDGLQLPDMSAPPLSPSTPSTSDEDDADELFLRFMLKEHAASVDDYLKKHPRREEVKKQLSPSSSAGSETVIDFMTKTRARKLHSEGLDDVFREVAGQVSHLAPLTRAEARQIDPLHLFSHPLRASLSSALTVVASTPSTLIVFFATLSM